MKTMFGRDVQTVSRKRDRKESFEMNKIDLKSIKGKEESKNS